MITLKDYDEGTVYHHWFEANKDDLKDMWESMGFIERHEEGGDFPTFCKGQYDNLL